MNNNIDSIQIRQKEMASEREKAGIEKRRAAMQEIRDMLAGVDGNSVDLDEIRTLRITSKSDIVD